MSGRLPNVATAIRSLLSAKRAPFLAMGVVLAFIGLAGPAEAKLRFGLHVGPQERNADQWTRMAVGQVALVRRDFAYTSNVAQYDEFMRDTSSAGLKVLPVVLGSPDGAVAPPRSKSDLDAYKSFTKRLVERYGRNGTFWSQNPALPYRPITAWQIWNEPSLDTFWDNDPNPREYADLVEVADDAIKSRDEDADSVLAGMPYDTSRGMPLEKFIAKFYDVGGIKKHFDAVAVHPYGRDEDDVEFILDRLRSRMKDAGDGGRDVWITEAGWGTDGPSGSPFVVGRKGQRRLLEKSFNLFEEERKRYNLDTVLWYNWQDIGTAQSGGPFHHYSGLFDHAGDAKPAWSKFTDFTGGSPGAGRLSDASAAKASPATDPLAITAEPQAVLPPEAELTPGD